MRARPARAAHALSTSFRRRDLDPGTVLAHLPRRIEARLHGPGPGGQGAALDAAPRRPRRAASRGHRGRDVPVLVSRQPLHRLLRRPQAEEGAVRGRRGPTICDAPDGRGGELEREATSSSSRPGPSVASPRRGRGGTPAAVTECRRSRERRHRLPCFLPDRQALPLLCGPVENDRRTIRIAVARPRTRKATLDRAREREGRYARARIPPLRSRRQSPRAAVRCARVEDDAAKRSRSPRRSSSARPLTRRRSAVRSGLLVYQPGVQPQRTPLTWFDLDGKDLGTIGEPAILTSLVPSRSPRTARGPRRPSSPRPAGRRPSGSTISSAGRATR